MGKKVSVANHQQPSLTVKLDKLEKVLSVRNIYNWLGRCEISLNPCFMIEKIKKKKNPVKLPKTKC